MAKVILFALLSSQNVFAAQGWFTRTCEYFLGGAAAKTPPVLMKLHTEMDNQLRWVNRTAEHQLKETMSSLDYVSGQAFGLEYLPQMSAKYSYVRRVDIRVFSHPAEINANWEDTETGLGNSPSLVLLFENDPVNYQGKQTDVAGILREEFASILDRNPKMTAELKMGPAKDLPGLEFRREYRDHLVAWVEGPLQNFQVKRSTLLMLETVFSRVNMDPAFAVKNEPTPTRH